jgi:hypothetical protein
MIEQICVDETQFFERGFVHDIGIYASMFHYNVVYKKGSVTSINLVFRSDIKCGTKR